MAKNFIVCMVSCVMCVVAIATFAFAADISLGTSWEKGVVRAKGFAAGKSTTQNKGLQMAQAKRAAIMDAQRNLASTVEGVRVSSESSMRDLTLEYDIVKTRMDAIIKGMQEVSEKYNDDGTCEVILEIPLFGSSQSVATAAFLPYKDQPKIPFPQPSTTVDANIIVTQNGAVGGESATRYTGLVVDCSGLNLNPVMSPVIKNNEGQSIYGHRNLDYNKVIELGMASYAESSIDSVSQSRAGNNPLVVKAVKVEGYNANPVVSVADADKILVANQSDQFLDNCAVVFVK